MLPPMRKESLFAWAAVVSWMALVSGGAVHAHPDHGGDEDHAHDPSETEGPSEKQKEKRLERVVRRAEARERNRVERTADERRNLRNRVARHLQGGELTPEIVAALQKHAETTAMLRQIRYVAAKAKDYESVVLADKVLARLNSQHERWWRTELRNARKKQ
jgi:hypothetical protein